MNSSRPIGSLSLDLDNQWSYLKVHGDSGWESFPSYLDLVIPRVLDFLAKRRLKITFFVVGQDAAIEKNHSALKMIAAAGHEVGNHSFSHEPWWNLWDRTRIEGEIALAEEHITKIFGKRPVGFRGPGFAFSELTLEVLERRNYLYDASSFPSFFGPLARLYYLSHSKLTANARKDRGHLFGSFRDGLRRLSPYRWGHRDGLLEIPLTTMPFLRSPIHLSYLLYISGFSSAAALAYFRSALHLCRVFGISPSLLLHPLDFLGADDCIGLEFFPAMQLSSGSKRNFLSQAIDIYCCQFRVVSVLAHAESVAARTFTPVVGGVPRPYSPLTTDL